MRARLFYVRTFLHKFVFFILDSGLTEKSKRSDFGGLDWMVVLEKLGKFWRQYKYRFLPSILLNFNEWYDSVYSE